MFDSGETTYSSSTSWATLVLIPAYSGSAAVMNREALKSASTLANASAIPSRGLRHRQECHRRQGRQHDDHRVGGDRAGDAGQRDGEGEPAARDGGDHAAHRGGD